MRAAAWGLAAAIACDPGGRVEEDVVTERELIGLPEAEARAILIVMDDTYETKDVEGWLGNGMKGFFYDVPHPFRMRFVSTYLTELGQPRWLDGGNVLDSDAASPGDFHVEFQQTVDPHLFRGREPLEPHTRAALGAALASDEGRAFVGQDPVVIAVLTAMSDFTVDTPQDRAALGTLVAGQPYGASVVLVTPQSSGCRYTFEPNPTGHDFTRQALGDSLVAEADTCDRYWLQTVFDTASDPDLPRWQNSLDVELAFSPLPGSLVVEGVDGDRVVPIPSAQIEVEGRRLRVAPPLGGVPQVRVTYQREVR
jgi:hypothetical protein